MLWFIHSPHFKCVWNDVNQNGPQRSHTEHPRAWVVCLQKGILIVCLRQARKLRRLSSVPKEAKISILNCVLPVVRTHILFFFLFLFLQLVVPALAPREHSPLPPSRRHPAPPGPWDPHSFSWTQSHSLEAELLAPTHCLPFQPPCPS